MDILSSTLDTTADSDINHVSEEGPNSQVGQKRKMSEQVTGSQTKKSKLEQTEVEKKSTSTYSPPSKPLINVVKISSLQNPQPKNTVTKTATNSNKNYVKSENRKDTSEARKVVPKSTKIQLLKR